MKKAEKYQVEWWKRTAGQSAMDFLYCGGVRKDLLDAHLLFPVFLEGKAIYSESYCHVERAQGAGNYFFDGYGQSWEVAQYDVAVWIGNEPAN